jgi:hypothetical protein
MQAVQQFGLRGEHDIMPLPGCAIAECLGQMISYRLSTLIRGL